MGFWKGFKGFFETVGLSGFGAMTAFLLCGVIIGLFIFFIAGVISGAIQLSDIL